MNEKALNRAYFLMRAISREKIPFWITDKKGNDLIFEYPVGTIEKWRKELNEILDKDIRERPNEFRMEAF